MNGACMVQNGSLVGIPIKAAAYLGDIVGHDQVKILVAELFLRVGHQRLRLGGETNEDPPVFPHTELTQNIRVGLQVEFQGPLSSFDLLAGKFLRVKVSHRGSH